MDLDLTAYLTWIICLQPWRCQAVSSKDPSSGAPTPDLVWNSHLSLRACRSCDLWSSSSQSGLLHLRSLGSVMCNVWFCWRVAISACAGGLRCLLVLTGDVQARLRLATTRSREPSPCELPSTYRSTLRFRVNLVFSYAPCLVHIRVLLSVAFFI